MSGARGALYSDLPSPKVPVASQVIFLTLYKFRSILVFPQRCASVWRTKHPFFPPSRGPLMLNRALGARSAGDVVLEGGSAGTGLQPGMGQGRLRGVVGAGPSSGQESVFLALWLELSPVDAL